MSNQHPLVSVIMPSYNSEITIKDSVQSVINQSYDNWELLITDDCSSDDTLRIIQELAQKDKRINFFSLPENGGAGKARNNSISEAKGRFIAFLDADDIWFPDKLEHQIDFMLKNDVALSYTGYQKFDSRGEQGVIKPPISITYKKLLYGNVIGCLTAIYDTAKVGKRFMPLIRKRQDMALWLDILKDVGFAQALPDVYAKYRTDTGMTVNKWKVLSYQWQLYRNVLKISFPNSLKYFLCYAFNGFIKAKK
ncbi:MAG: glycosyltransferase family 2 protein [Pseudomonadota bacterium]|nr:glycosyltransferase family 2 protein [Pseudomonadota bacterium]